MSVKRYADGRFLSFDDGQIIFLDTEVNDYTANVIQAQLLYLDSVDQEKNNRYI